MVGVRTGNGFYLQDPAESEYGGVFVYDGGANTVTVGEGLSCTGTYMEYYGLTEVAYAECTSSGSTSAPAPVAIADACDVATGGSLAELYESMLITVSDLSVTDSNPDASAGGDYGEFEVNGCLRFDDELWDGLVPQPSVGTAYGSITGVLSYRYENFKVLPRSADDMVE